MQLSEFEIEELGELFKTRLKKGRKDLPDNNYDLSKIQEWLIRHKVENPDVLKLITKLTETRIVVVYCILK